MTEREAMERALGLAWRGWGRAHPNPLVGAVLLRDGAVVGEGWHGEWGGAHAEIVALSAAGEAARGATAVTTLEPCAHIGKQPSCAEALIAAGVRRVVIAMRDPNPVARGGMERLRAAGIEVEAGPLADEAATQNAIFLHAWRGSPRPYVALKLATTVDGRIADARGRSRWISGAPARDYVHWLRAGFDAIATGAHTATLDDPSLTVRGAVVPRLTPTRVVFDRSAGLSPDSVLALTAGDTPTLVVTSPAAFGSARVHALAERGVRILSADSLGAALEQLRQEGIMSMLVEGGGKLAGALLAENAVDRYYWIQSPVFLGQGAVPAMVGVPDASLAAAPRWTVVERRALGDDTLLVLDRERCSPES